MKEKLSSGYRGYDKNYKVRCCKQGSKANKIKKPRSSKSRVKKRIKKKQPQKSYYQAKKSKRKDGGLSHFVIYSIVNTDFFENRGNLASEVAKGFLALYLKADADKLKSEGLESWENSGEKFFVLNGINHKHLRYLAEEVCYVATEYHCLYRNYGKSKIMLVLSVLGRQEDFGDVLETLTALR